MEPVTSATRSTTSSPPAHTGGDGYHHGDLPNALRRAAAEVIAERGLGAFSLREVARRAGVSHTAPAHHFGDVKGLLTSIAEEGFDALYAATTAARDGLDDPAERLAAIGVAYVEQARSHPAHCEVMFRTDVVDTGCVSLQEAGMRAYGVLEDTVRELLDADHLAVDLDLAVRMCWSAMQGLVVLAPKFDVIQTHHGEPAIPMREQVASFVEILVAGFRNVAT
jgi:AcrR family transcriptional regulator